MEPERSATQAKKTLGKQITSILRAGKLQRLAAARLLNCSTKEISDAKRGVLSEVLLRTILVCSEFHLYEEEKRDLEQIPFECKG